MRIGINASFLRKPYTGIGQVTVNFLKKLTEFPISIRQLADQFPNNRIEFVLYLEEDIDLKLPENFQKRVFLSPYRRDDLIRKIWWEKFLLPRRAAKDKCDAFLSLYQCPTVMPKRIRHVMLVHDIIPRIFPEYLSNSRKKLYQWLTERAIKRADRIVAVSGHTEKDLIRYLGLSPEKISAQMVDVDPIFKQPVSEKKSREVMEKYQLHPGYLYSGGGLEKRKNIERLIHAYKLLIEEQKQGKIDREIPRLIISGKLLPQLAPLVTDVEKLVLELNLSGHVQVIGFVGQADLPSLYANALAFVYPSLYEGFGLPVLEAMNQGTPVIAGKVSSIPEVAGDAVRYTDVENVGGIAQALKEIVLDTDLRRQLSERGRERARIFTWDQFTKHILHSIASLKI